MIDSLNQINHDYLEIDAFNGNLSHSNQSSFTRLIDSLNTIETSNLTYEPWLTVLIAIVAGLMSSITIIGNVLVITAFIIDKNLRKYSNYFILNLSVADLLIGILIPPYAPFMLNNRLWKFGKVACTLWLVFDYVVGSASVLCIVVISLDRYLLVSRGLTYVSSQRISKALFIIITVWSIAFFNYAPAIVFWEIISKEQTVKEGECQVAFHDNLVYLTATACVEFFAPLISICGLNLAVYLNIRKRSRGLIRTENPLLNLEKSINAKKKKQNVIQHTETKQNFKSGQEMTAKKIVNSASSSGSCSSDDSPKTEKNKNESNFLINDNKENLNADIQNTKSKSLVSLALESNHAACTSILVGTKSATSPYSPYLKPKRNSSNRNLSKDKKAARSLFILVFAFVFCWVIFVK